MGDTVNVASRLEGVATRGQILVTQSTYRLTHGIFEFRPLEPVRVQGKKDALAVFELLERKNTARHEAWPRGTYFAARRPRVGVQSNEKSYRRDQARPQRTYSRLRRCRGGKKPAPGGNAILRIRRRYLARGTLLRLYPNPELCPDPRPSPKTYRHHGQQKVEEQQATLRRHVETNFSADPQVYAVLAQLLALSLTNADAEFLKALKGEEFRARFFAIVEQGLLSLAEQQPVVVMIDDLHWADASCVDLLASVLPLLKANRLTFIAVTRSRQTPTRLWSKLGPALEECRDHLVEIPLQSLSNDESRTLMERSAGWRLLT